MDSPELAALGRYCGRGANPDSRGTRCRGRHRAQQDRRVVVDLWYPANVAGGRSSRRSTARVCSPNRRHHRAPGALHHAGLAVRDAPAAPGRYPLVVVSHGRSNPTIALSWLTENLASKGYVVAAIRHEDLARDRSREPPEMLLRRPLDIAFVTRSLQESLDARGAHRSARYRPDRLFDGRLRRPDGGRREP